MAVELSTTTAAPLNPSTAEAALAACGPAQMEGCTEALRDLAAEPGDASTFADRAALFRKAIDFLAGAGHDRSIYGPLAIPDDVTSHPDAPFFDAFVRVKAAEIFCNLADAPDWSPEQDRLAKLVDDAEGAFFAMEPKSAVGTDLLLEQFILTNDDGSGTAGAYSKELLAAVHALAERERAWLRPLSSDPLPALFEQRKALEEKLHDDLAAATNRADEEAVNHAFVGARDRIEAEIIASPPTTRAGLLFALNVVRDELAAGEEEDYHAPLLATLAEAIERAPF